MLYNYYQNIKNISKRAGKKEKRNHSRNRWTLEITLLSSRKTGEALFMPLTNETQAPRRPVSFLEAIGKEMSKCQDPEVGS